MKEVTAAGGHISANESPGLLLLVNRPTLVQRIRKKTWVTVFVV